MRLLTAKQWILVIGVPLLAGLVGVGLGWALWGSRADAPDASAPSPSSGATPAPSVTPSSAVPVVPGEPVSACRAEFTINAWEGGWQGNVVVTALADITEWEVLLDVKPGKVTQAWNTTLAAGSTGALVPAGNVDYNGVLAAGASTTFGFAASGAAPDGEPTASCWTPVQVVLDADGTVMAVE